MDDKYKCITLYDINFYKDKEISKKLTVFLDKALDEFDKNKQVNKYLYVDEINDIISTYNCTIPDLTKETLEIAIYNTLSKINCGYCSSYELF